MKKVIFFIIAGIIFSQSSAFSFFNLNMMKRTGLFGQWVATSLTSAPSKRQGHSAVWTGSKMIVWGGAEVGSYFNNGGIYDPATDTWTAMTTIGAPVGRMDSVAVWTGTKMIVWGGMIADGGVYTDTGASYDLATDTWTPITMTNAPSARRLAKSIWTGTKMIVWGEKADRSGGVYDPSNNTWTTMSTVNAPVAALSIAAVWTGSKMIVWGGYDGSNFSNAGAMYDPSNNTWTAIDATNAPTARNYHTATWTGSKMIVWGGQNSGAHYNTGGMYDPATDTWTAMTTTGAPLARGTHSSVWTGSKMIVWGGLIYIDETSIYLNTGGVYDPVSNSWSSVELTNAPIGRYTHTAIWTGSKMIVWGGYVGPSAGAQTQSGGSYTFNSGAAATLALTVTSGNASTMNVTGVTEGIAVTGSNVTFTLTNNVGATSSVISFALSNATNFELNGGTCSNGVTMLEASASCTVIVRPKATGNGALSGNLNITANNSPSAAMSGTASGFAASCDSPGEVCSSGAIFLGTLGADNYMTTPGGCSDIPAGSVSGGSGVTSYANSDFTPSSCSGTDALNKTWNDGTANYYNIPSLTNYTTTDGIGHGAVNVDANYGSVNTANIVAITGGAQGGYHSAARYCDKLMLNGYTDWYLPNRYELNLMFTNKASIPGLDTTGNWYWSSTELDNRYVWIQRFSDGGQSSFSKNLNRIVRCVRRF